MTISNTKKKEFIRLRAEGMSLRTIAKKLEISYNTSLSLSRSLHSEIKNLESIEIESIIESALLAKKARIEILAVHITRVREEIERRDFSDIPTIKLFDILKSLQENLGKELEDTRFLYALNSSDLADYKPLSKEPILGS